MRWFGGVGWGGERTLVCLLHRLGLFLGFRLFNFTFVCVCVGGGGRGEGGSVFFFFFFLLLAICGNFSVFVWVLY